MKVPNPLDSGKYIAEQKLAAGDTRDYALKNAKAVIRELNRQLSIVSQDNSNEQTRIRRQYQDEINRLTEQLKKHEENIKTVEVPGVKVIFREEDTAVVAQAAGNEQLRIDCQIWINDLSKIYKEQTEVSGLKPRRERMTVEGFKRVKFYSDADTMDHLLDSRSNRQLCRRLCFHRCMCVNGTHFLPIPQNYL